MRIFKALSFLAIAAIAFSCKKDTVVENSKQIGISKITYYATFNLHSDKLTIINKGTPYTDPIEVTVEGKGVPFKTTGSVDVATPGVYNISYSATNSDGYASSAWRTVVVMDPAVAANDFSGKYFRAATGVTCTWTKTATGTYTVDNPGGATTGVGYLVTVINYTGNKIAIPQQVAADPDGAQGVVSSGSEAFNPATGEFSWIFYASGYGTGLRSFTKQ